MNATGMPAAHADRDIRQREIVPPEKLAGCHVVVVGVGAIGRQVALQLAAVGVPSLELFDHDTVEVENLAAQAYWPQDLARPKVNATADVCRLIYPQVQLVAHPARFRRSFGRSLGNAGKDVAVFCCVRLDRDPRTGLGVGKGPCPVLCRRPHERRGHPRAGQ